MTINYKKFGSDTDVRTFGEEQSIVGYTANGNHDVNSGITLITEKSPYDEGMYYIVFVQEIKTASDESYMEGDVVPLVKTFIMYPELPENMPCTGDCRYGPLDADEANLVHKYAAIKAYGQGHEDRIEEIVDELRHSFGRPAHNRPSPSLPVAIQG